MYTDLKLVSSFQNGIKQLLDYANPVLLWGEGFLVVFFVCLFAWEFFGLDLVGGIFFQWGVTGAWFGFLGEAVFWFFKNSSLQYAPKPILFSLSSSYIECSLKLCRTAHIVSLFLFLLDFCEEWETTVILHLTGQVNSYIYVSKVDQTVGHL